jgi:Type IV secretion-system coupling protein DNA-binding domain
MANVHDQLSEQFYRWELRGRGWQVYGEPVFPEPPFVPFQGHFQPDTPVIDDGRRPTFLSSLFRKVTAPPQPPPIICEPEDEPEPTPLVRDSLVEFQASLPEKLDASSEAFQQFLLNLSLCREPIAFELLGTPGKVTAQFAAGSSDAPLLRRQLQAFFSEAVFVPREGALDQAWETSTGAEALAVEFGLGREFMLPLASGRIDPFIGIVGALSELQPAELGLFQVLWQPVHNRWAESIVASVTGADGKPFFINQPELTDAAENKIASPLFAAVVRILVRADGFDRMMQLATDLAGSLRVFAHPNGNELIPLRNDHYPFEEHIEDVLRRQTRRTGMLLNSDELIGFVHLPGSAIRSPVFQRQTTKTKSAPPIVRQRDGLLLGSNEHAGQTVSVRLTAEQRVKHCHIIGASGTGKSTLLFNSIKQDLESGDGLAVLDPHGDLIDKILGVIPPERIGDVVLVDPSDDEYSVGFNILSAHSELEKTLLASDLVAVFQRLSTSWGDQMNSVLQNAILAFLESDRPGTIADLRRFLIEPAFRNDFLKSVRDSEVVYYWQKSFPLLAGNKSIGSILTRLDGFLSKKPIRYMVSQPENRLDFARIMDNGQIFLAKLPEGLLGRENMYLLGTLLVSKFQQIVMSRQAQQVATRRDFWLYIDEFANFITPSMAEILSGARKYRIGLTLAHHELQQLQRSPEVASAVLTHPYTRIVFRVGDDDARKLAEGFSYFEAKNLRNLETGQAVCRVERSDFDFNLTIPLSAEPDQDAATARRQEVITCSRKKYGMARADVEAMAAVPLPAIEIKPPKEVPPSPLPEPVKPKPPSPPSPFVSEPPQDTEVPKPAEVPKETGSEKKTVGPVVVNQSANEVVSEPQAEMVAAAPAALGRGGAPHQAIQERLQAEAQALGFLAEVEKQLAKGSNQAADLVLKRDSVAIAVEIAAETTTSHEFENVQKCLAAGFVRVAMVSTSPKRLENIAAAVKGGLGPEAAAKVGFFSPDEFIAELRKLAAALNTGPQPPSPPNEQKRRGLTVRRHLPQLSPDEQKLREDAVHKMLAEAMRRRK